MPGKKTKSLKFRSKFEKRIYENIVEDQRGLVDYEPQDPVIAYTTSSRYIPDLRLPGDVFVECKGYFDARSRAKMLAVKRQNPSLDIRFLFQRANNRLTKSPNSLMYWQWAEKHGFPWGEGEVIPEEWWVKIDKT